MRGLLVLPILCLVGTALAAPTSTRVVLVDPDPELRRAMATALEPWRLEVVVDAAPIDEAVAPQRATALNARFVVWRSGADLVVFDRDKGDTQHREVVAGELDPVDAAAAALTVKTLMRLPPPGEVTSPPRVGGRELRLQVGAGLRVAHGSQTATTSRFAGTIMVKPATAQLRVGLWGELGTSDGFEQGNLTGTYGDWALLAVASFSVARGSLELEPMLAAGVARSHTTGAAMMGMMATELDERATLLTLRAGAWARYRLTGMWSVGAGVALEGTPGTPTYTRAMNDQVLYEVPGVGLSLGIVVAGDLGR